MTIRLDRSRSSTLAYCTACPSWHALRNDDASAWAAANEHERAVHPTSTRASNALSAARRRLA